MKQKQDPILTNFKLAIFKSGKKKIEIAELMGISDGHLVNILNGRDVLSEDKKSKLNKILKTDF